MPDRKKRQLSFVAVLAGALAIAFSPIFVKLSEIPPTATAFHRVFLALPLFVPWLILERRVRHRNPPGPQSRRLWLVLAGLFFAGDLAVWHWSLAFTSVANSTLLANLAPVFVTLAVWLLFDEQITPLFLLGLAASLAGAALLVGASFTFGERQLLGDALALATAVFYAGYLVSVKELRRSLGTASLLLGSSAISALPLLFITLVAGEELLPETMTGWFMLLGVAWVSQVLGQGLIAFGIGRLPASFSSVTLLVQPAASALLAWPILGEELTAWQALGGLGVLGGIVLAGRGSEGGLGPVRKSSMRSLHAIFRGRR